MEKRVVLNIFIFLILINSVLFASAFSSTEEKTKVAQAYSCLDNLITTKECSGLSLDEAIFTKLAIGNCSSKIEENKDSTNSCWPNGNCDLKLTSQAILANSRLKENTTDSEKWLLSQTFTPTNLIWYLEIDSNNVTTCEIKYGTETHSITIGADKKIVGDAGNCLKKSFSDYWFSIDKNCYENTYEIKCNKGFVTTLIFQRNTTEFAPYHVMKTTHSASAGGTTFEKIESSCFGKSGICDYEGSLWAVTVLDYKNYNVSKYLPYLIDGWDRIENRFYMPATFLYLITGKTEYKSQIITDQNKANGYWENSAGSSFENKYFDTGLAIWPFDSKLIFAEKTKAKEWLFSVQAESGCWSGENVKDTSWILYTIWPQAIKSNCVKNLDCPNGMICSNEKCIITNKNCTLDDQCSISGEVCINGVCTNNKTCLLDIHCPDGKVCKNKLCIVDPNAPKCTSNLNCTHLGTNFICKGGICVKGGTLNKNCTNSSDCPGQICVNKVCIDETENCADKGYFCMIGASCTGSVLSQYDCTGTLKCCNQSKTNQTCASLDGKTCTSSQYCSGGTPRATDGLSTGQTCCIGGNCTAKTVTNNSCTKNSDCASGKICTNKVCVNSGTGSASCENTDGLCESSGVCGKGYSENNLYSCTSSLDICCIKDTTPASKLWIWILLVLIVLIALGIVFREKIGAFILRLKTQFGKRKNKGPGPMHPGLPGHPGPPMSSPIYPRTPPRNYVERRVLPPAQQQRAPLKPTEPIRRPLPQPVKKSAPKSKEELDDVLKKLKEMSK